MRNGFDPDSQRFIVMLLNRPDALAVLKVCGLTA